MASNAYAVLEGTTLTFIRSDEAGDFFNGMMAPSITDVAGNVYRSVRIMTDIEGSFGLRIPDTLKMFVRRVRAADGQTFSLSTGRDIFKGCYNMETCDLTGIDISDVSDMFCMFKDCSSLKSLDLSTSDTYYATEMWGSFAGCESLETIDLSGWDTSHVDDMSNTFSGCANLRFARVAGCDVGTVEMLRCTLPKKCRTVIAWPRGEGVPDEIHRMDALDHLLHAARSTSALCYAIGSSMTNDEPHDYFGDSLIAISDSLRDAIAAYAATLCPDV